MQLSDALPIQFWDIDDVTPNESSDENVDSQCFFWEKKNDEEIKHQIYDTAEFAYQLLIEDSEGNEIIRLPYVFTSSPTPRHDVAFTPALLTPAIDDKLVRFKILKMTNIVVSPNFEDSGDWTNSGVGGNWTILSNTAFLNFTGSGQSSKNFVQAVLPDMYSGEFIVRMRVNQDQSANAIHCKVLLGATAVDFYTDGLGDYDFEAHVSGIAAFNQIKINAIAAGLDTKKITVYNVSVFPVDSASWEQVKKSELTRITPTPEANILIKYKSTTPVAGIVYNSDDGYYLIRVKGRFWYPRFPTEQVSEDLSTSEVVVTAASVKRQRLLTLDDCPDWLAYKLILILQHGGPGTLSIPEREGAIAKLWKMADSQDENIPEANGYPFTGFGVYLTEKNSYVRTLT